MFMHHHHDWGLLSLAAALVFISLLCAIQPGRTARVVYPAGEIAAHDGVSDRDLLVEDPQATQLRRDRALALQPMVFDIDKKAIESFREESLGLIDEINKRGLDNAGLENVRRAFNERHLSDVSAAAFRQLTASYVQEYLLGTLIPWMESTLSNGVIADMRQIANTDNAVIVRDLDSGTEVLRTQAGGLKDLRSFQVALGRKLRAEDKLSSRAKVVLQEVMPLMVVPSLAVNQEVTSQRNEEMLAAVEPVFYKVQPGEVLVRAGDMVTHEQQIKLQALFRATPGVVDWHVFGGCVVLGLFLLLGLFITPSGNKGTVLRTKDQNLIALLLVFFGGTAWCTMYVLVEAASASTAHVLAFAFPVAGGTGMAALIFAARRYCTVGLVLSFFATVIFRGEIALFFFYFMSSMTNTWLVLRAQNRQDVVWGSVPLLIWMLMTGVGAALFIHLEWAQLPFLLLALICNAVGSLFLLFALSPVLEMLMGYTTRFRMMELMNLEHPLLQELMMTVPGTYHHSLVVSNLVEAGAAAIGANSLLCKVGALYHDIGKISRPEYFVENQFGGPNPHDKLSPAMSALILFSHVKQGAELAEEYHLGREITDIIVQHHGTRGAMYFYNKAQQMGENPRLQDYSYPGPRPQSKEAAIVMLADSVEASSRTLVDPTPARIRAHVTKIVKGVYAEGQLDESDLTFRDLNKLIDSFVRGITGLFHQRIAYPEEKPDPHKNGRKNEECRKDEAEELRPDWVIEPGRAKEKREKGAQTERAAEQGACGSAAECARPCDRGATAKAAPEGNATSGGTASGSAAAGHAPSCDAPAPGNESAPGDAAAGEAAATDGESADSPEKDA